MIKFTKEEIEKGIKSLKLTSAIWRTKALTDTLKSDRDFAERQHDACEKRIKELEIQLGWSEVES